MISVIAISGCAKPHEVNTNPWLVPFQERHGSSVSRSQMRAMVRLAHIYRDHGLENEYLHALTTGVELFAGDGDVTFELINVLIDRINQSIREVSQLKAVFSQMEIDPATLSSENLPAAGEGEEEAIRYLEAREELEARYEECYRILSTACGQIPYNPELYYRTASLQFLRAEEDGDRAKYRDAINFLKRAIASDSSHLESYHLIARAYECLEDTDRAIRFWRLYEVIYEIGPETMGAGFITPHREEMHNEATERLTALGADAD